MPGDGGESARKLRSSGSRGGMAGGGAGGGCGGARGGGGGESLTVHTLAVGLPGVAPGTYSYASGLVQP